MTPALFTEYENMKTENFMVINVNEEKVSCPNCDTIYIISKSAQNFKCVKCDQNFCSNNECLGEWKSHTNLTCAQYKNIIENKEDNANKDFRIFFEKYNLKKCPVCFAPIIKMGNCNYVVCESRKCQKKTTFCYICGEKLEGEEKNSHFKDSNFYQKCVEKEKNEKEFKKLYDKGKENKINTGYENRAINLNNLEPNNKIIQKRESQIKNENTNFVYFSCFKGQCALF